MTCHDYLSVTTFLCQTMRTSCDCSPNEALRAFLFDVQVHLPAFPGGQMQLRRSVPLQPWSAWIACPRPRPGCLTRQGEHIVSMLKARIVEIIAAACSLNWARSRSTWIKELRMVLSCLIRSVSVCTAKCRFVIFVLVCSDDRGTMQPAPSNQSAAPSTPDALFVFPCRLHDERRWQASKSTVQPVVDIVAKHVSDGH